MSAPRASHDAVLENVTETRLSVSTAAASAFHIFVFAERKRLGVFSERGPRLRDARFAPSGARVREFRSRASRSPAPGAASRATAVSRALASISSARLRSRRGHSRRLLGAQRSSATPRRRATTPNASLPPPPAARKPPFAPAPPPPRWPDSARAKRAPSPSTPPPAAGARRSPPPRPRRRSRTEPGPREARLLRLGAPTFVQLGAGPHRLLAPRLRLRGFRHPRLGLTSRARTL